MFVLRSNTLYKDQQTTIHYSPIKRLQGSWHDLVIQLLGGILSELLGEFEVVLLTTVPITGRGGKMRGGEGRQYYTTVKNYYNITFVCFKELYKDHQTTVHCSLIKRLKGLVAWSCNPTTWRHVLGEFEVVLLKTVPIIRKGRVSEERGGEGWERDKRRGEGQYYSIVKKS